MTKALTSTVLAFSLAVTSIGATPALANHDSPAASQGQSSNNQLGGLIAGAVTLFILGSAIENKKKQKAKAHASELERKRIAAAAKARAAEQARLEREREKARKEALKRKKYMPKPNKPRPPKHAHQHYRLPADCQFEVRTRREGRKEVFGKHCLEEFARLPRLLPERCAEVVNIRHGRRAEVYDAQCMFDRGYKVEARRR